MNKIHFLLTLIIAFIMVMLIMNRSVHNYIEQKYHISLFNPNMQILQIIGKPREWLDNLREMIFKEGLIFNEANEQITQDEVIQDEIKHQHYPFIDDYGHIVLKPHSTFLLIGDSMMQGVGLSLVSKLKKLGMNVVNLSKQSTGLTYKHFFDWQDALRASFEQYGKIDVVVVMVGANDPYNMPKIRYGSKEWEDEYSLRIDDILQTAINNGAVAVWYGMPIVKKEPLNSKLAYLNGLYEERTIALNQVFLDSNIMLAPEHIYSAYRKDDEGRNQKIRADDGIHFSIEGSRLLSDMLISRLNIKQELESLEDSVENNTTNASIDSTHTDYPAPTPKTSTNPTAPIKPAPKKSLSIDNIINNDISNISNEHTQIDSRESIQESSVVSSDKESNAPSEINTQINPNNQQYDQHITPTAPATTSNTLESNEKTISNTSQEMPSDTPNTQDSIPKSHDIQPNTQDSIPKDNTQSLQPSNKPSIDNDSPTEDLMDWLQKGDNTEAMDLDIMQSNNKTSTLANNHSTKIKDQPSIKNPSASESLDISLKNRKIEE